MPKERRPLHLQAQLHLSICPLAQDNKHAAPNRAASVRRAETTMWFPWLVRSAPRPSLAVSYAPNVSDERDAATGSRRVTHARMGVLGLQCQLPCACGLLGGGAAVHLCQPHASHRSPYWGGGSPYPTTTEVTEVLAGRLLPWGHAMVASTRRRLAGAIRVLQPQPFFSLPQAPVSCSETTPTLRIPPNCQGSLGFVRL